MTPMLTLVIAFAATGLLALGMGVHARAAITDDRWLCHRARAVRKIGGWILVGLTLAVAVAKFDWGAGVVFWLLALAVTGFGVTLLVTYRPRVLPIAVGAAALLAAGMGLALGFV